MNDEDEEAANTTGVSWRQWLCTRLVVGCYCCGTLQVSTGEQFTEFGRIARHLCAQCNENGFEEDDIDFSIAIINKKGAMKTFGLKDKEIEALPRFNSDNPYHRNAAPVKNFITMQAYRIACRKHGGTHEQLIDALHGKKKSATARKKVIKENSNTKWQQMQEILDDYGVDVSVRSQTEMLKNTSSKRALAQRIQTVANMTARKAALTDAFAARKLKMRSDSKLCDAYLTGLETYSLEFVVDTMVEMDFLFKHTSYPTEMKVLYAKQKRTTANRRAEKMDMSDYGIYGSDLEPSDDDDHDSTPVLYKHEDKTKHAKKNAWTQYFASHSIKTVKEKLPACIYKFVRIFMPAEWKGQFADVKDDTIANIEKKHFTISLQDITSKIDNYKAKPKSKKRKREEEEEEDEISETEEEDEPVKKPKKKKARITKEPNEAPKKSKSKKKQEEVSNTEDVQELPVKKPKPKKKKEAPSPKVDNAMEMEQQPQAARPRRTTRSRKAVSYVELAGEDGDDEDE